MSFNNMHLKSSCDRFRTHSKAFCTTKTVSKIVIPKKVVPSNKLSSNSSYDGKSCSTSVISKAKKSLVKPKKTTKSDMSFAKKIDKKAYSVDYCKKCGDVLNNIDTATTNTVSKVNEDNVESHTSVCSTNLKSVDNDNRIKSGPKITKSVQQYYKNENFGQSTESFVTGNGLKKVSLDTIKEVSEAHSLSSVFQIYSDTEDNEVFDTKEQENIKRLKEFRRQNYFECHSAESRIHNKGSATSLNNHECVYRFYLNDRLFPVPLTTDYENTIRCVECCLPMDLKSNDEGNKINGTVQAKVALGKDVQDLTLLLPIKDSLIIKERRKEQKVNPEELYFGVIKLDSVGNSIFSQTLPSDSLALKYQKGYKEFQNNGEYRLKDVSREDVIVI